MILKRADWHRVQLLHRLPLGWLLPRFSRPSCTVNAFINSSGVVSNNDFIDLRMIRCTKYAHWDASRDTHTLNEPVLVRSTGMRLHRKVSWSRFLVLLSKTTKTGATSPHLRSSGDPDPLFAISIKSCPCTNFHKRKTHLTFCLSRFDALTSIPLSYLDLLVYLVSSGSVSGRRSSIELPWYM